MGLDFPLSTFFCGFLLLDEDFSLLASLVVFFFFLRTGCRGYQQHSHWQQQKKNSSDI